MLLFQLKRNSSKLVYLSFEVRIVAGFGLKIRYLELKEFPNATRFPPILKMLQFLLKASGLIYKQVFSFHQSVFPLIVAIEAFSTLPLKIMNIYTALNNSVLGVLNYAYSNTYTFYCDINVYILAYICVHTYGAMLAKILLKYHPLVTSNGAILGTPC